jgi:hypothetical protein
MSPSFRSLHISQSKATLRGRTESDHSQDFIVLGIAAGSVYQDKRQVRVGDAILQLQKDKVAGLGAAVVAVTRNVSVNVLAPIPTPCA